MKPIPFLTALLIGLLFLPRVEALDVNVNLGQSGANAGLDALKSPLVEFYDL